MISKLYNESELLQEIILQANRGDFRKKWQRLAKEQLISIYKDLIKIYIQEYGKIDEQIYRCNYYIEKKYVLDKIEQISQEIDMKERFI